MFERVVDHRPEYAAALRAVDEALWAQDVVDPIVLELCRLRIAQLLDSPDELARRTPTAVAAGLDEAMVSELRQWPTSDRFDARLRTCLGYAEQVLVDAQAVSDEQAAAVVAAMGDGGLLVLTYGCGFFETNARARIVLALEGVTT
ncbi:MAG: carboxymuconolactone decarboxylase family protein [Acidimicrobiia bacterium]